MRRKTGENVPRFLLTPLVEILHKTLNVSLVICGVGRKKRPGCPGQASITRSENLLLWQVGREDLLDLACCDVCLAVLYLQFDLALPNIGNRRWTSASQRNINTKILFYCIYVSCSCVHISLDPHEFVAVLNYVN